MVIIVIQHGNISICMCMYMCMWLDNYVSILIVGLLCIACFSILWGWILTVCAIFMPVWWW